LLPEPAVGVRQPAAQVATSATQPKRETRGILAYRPDIDGLRGLAVGLVVAYHAFPGFRTGGFVGVDVFFVISGYLITQIVLSGLQAGTFSLGEFYRRRVRRIAPALVVVMAACLIAGWLFLLPSELRWLGKSIEWCVPFLANAYFAGTGGYFDSIAELNPLVHLWSLAVEEQFYLGWPVLLMLTAKRRMTLPCIAALIVTSLTFSVWSAWFGVTSHFYSPATRAWELAVGGMLAAWQLSGSRTAAPDDSSSVLPRIGAQAMTLLGLTLIVVGGVCWTVDQRIPGIWSVLPTGGAALIIGAGPHAAASRWFLASRPMIVIGRISYPLYLWHWPMLAFTRVILGHRPTPGMAGAEMVIAVIAAWATYRFLESPIRSGQLGPKVVPLLVGGLVLLGSAGVAVESRWITGRLSGPLIAKWNQARNDWHYPGQNQDAETGFGKLVVTSGRDRKAVFIGDSHLQQYWPRVQHVIDMHASAARSAVFAASPGCPPLPGIHSPRREKNCSGFLDYAMKQAYQPDVDTVVFGAFWEYYFIGEYSTDRSVSRVYGAPATSSAPLQLDSPTAQLGFEKFQQVVAGLVSSGRRVFIVLSNPTSPLFEPLFPPELRFTLRLPDNLPRGRAPRIDAAGFESFVAPLMDRLRAIAARTGAKPIDPRSTLCDSMICPAADSNELPLYLDSNHINGVNARERASFVDEILLGPDAPLNR
jgi:peptidoglycan/LPS O-acetylase OafA/YrhL